MAEQIEWEPLALSLLNLLDKCEIDSEEVTYLISQPVYLMALKWLFLLFLSWQILLMMNDSLSFLSLVRVFAKFIDTGCNNLLRMREGQPVLWI